MRVRDHDCLEAAELVDLLAMSALRTQVFSTEPTHPIDRLFVQQWNKIPQDVATVGADELSAVANRELSVS